MDAPTYTEVKDDVAISRGMHEITTVPLDKIKNFFVYDDLGNKIRFSDIYANQKTIVVFVRHFLCYVCKEYVEDLARIPVEYLQDFQKLTGLTHTMYVDPDREIYKSLGCAEKVAQVQPTVSKHVKSNMLMGILKSTWRAMRSPREFQGAINQQGASLILGPGDVQHYAHLDQSPTDHTSINDLLAIAGVSEVSFEKDPRVQHV